LIPHATFLSHFFPLWHPLFVLWPFVQGCRVFSPLGGGWWSRREKLSCLPTDYFALDFFSGVLPFDRRLPRFFVFLLGPKTALFLMAEPKFLIFAGYLKGRPCHVSLHQSFLDPSHHFFPLLSSARFFHLLSFVFLACLVLKTLMSTPLRSPSPPRCSAVGRIVLPHNAVFCFLRRFPGCFPKNRCTGAFIRLFTNFQRVPSRFACEPLSSFCRQGGLRFTPAWVCS